MYCFQFAVFLLAILIVEIAIGIVVFVKMDEEGWEQTLNESITEKFAQFPYSGDASNIVVQEINNFQRDVSWCCMLKKIWASFLSHIQGLSCAPASLNRSVLQYFNAMFVYMPRHAVMSVRQLHICFDQISYFNRY